MHNALISRPHIITGADRLAVGADAGMAMMPVCDQIFPKRLSLSLIGDDRKAAGEVGKQIGRRLGRFAEPDDRVVLAELDFVFWRENRLFGIIFVQEDRVDDGEFRPVFFIPFEDVAVTEGDGIVSTGDCISWYGDYRVAFGLPFIRIRHGFHANQDFIQSNCLSASVATLVADAGVTAVKEGVVHGT